MHTKLPHPVHVTRSLVPDENQYAAGMHEMISRHWFTNHGPFVGELERRLLAYLDIPNITLTTNGTTALLLALRCAGMARREVITTPFTYVGTLSSLLWEACTPVFCDIDEETLCLDPAKLDATACENPAGIMPVHIYGNACDIESIDTYAAEHDLTVIYDAAQAFGSTYKQESLLKFGDFSICSFHSTKTFHTVEGGCVIAKTSENAKKVRLMSAFGHVGDTHYTLGINAKMSEPHALMGLTLIDRVADNVAGRARVTAMYDAILPAQLRKPRLNSGLTAYNYSYYPVIFEQEKALLAAVTKLNACNIFPRRYFYPSLNTLPYVTTTASCPVSESVAKRVLALPLYADLEESIVAQIIAIIKECL